MVDSTGICCSLTPEQQKARRAQVRDTIVPLVHTAVRSGSNLRIEFAESGETRALVEEFIALERACCGFLRFALSEPGDQLSVSIQGPAEAVEVIEMFRRTVRGELQ